METDDLGSPPDLAHPEWEGRWKAGDHTPIFFEWYKYVGGLAAYCSAIRFESPAISNIKNRDYLILCGLMNRCAKLMHGSVALTYQGRFGETMSIIQRSIFESCILLSWLSKEFSDDHFDRFVASGLRSELELKGEIHSNVARRGSQTPLEMRMLMSISNYIKWSELSESQIIVAKKLPDLAAMVAKLGKNRLDYVVGQRLGSHHVHGTWPGLLLDYLDYENEPEKSVYFGESAPHLNQYVSTCISVLDALMYFVNGAFFTLPDDDSLKTTLRSRAAELYQLYTSSISIRDSA